MSITFEAQSSFTSSRVAAFQLSRRQWFRRAPLRRIFTNIGPSLTWTGAGLSLSQAMADATKRIIAIDSHLKEQVRAIIRRVCGEGWWPSEAVREACGEHYDKAIVPRFCEALDNLIEAIEAARRRRSTPPPPTR